MTTYFVVAYDNEASGPFVAEDLTNLLTWNAGADKAMIVTLIDRGTTGKLVCALMAGTIPVDGQVLTQNTTTADANGDGKTLLYPAYFREDIEVPSTGIMAWTGPALGSTHSFYFDGQTANVVAGEILTFSGGHTCEVITVESDAGVSGELSVRFISDVDQGVPADNDTFTGDIIGDGVVNGLFHDRAYSPLHLHRLLSDLNDDEDIAGDDDLSRIDPTPSGKDTNKIVNLLSTMVINDTIAQHMYDGSISQASGATIYGGLNLQVTTPNADTQPVLIQNDGIVTDYWKNAFMSHSIDGNIRILKKIKDEGVYIDGGRLKGKLLEFGDSYFEGGTTLGLGTTALALFSSPDGNNTTDSATVAGAPYNTIVVTEGYGTIDYGNGNGAKPYDIKIDFGSASSAQTYERTKYIQRRGTAETLFGRNAQLFVGNNRNFAYDGESANLTPAEIVVWGTVVPYTLQGATSFTVGEVVTFSGGSKARILYDNDAGASGTLIVDMDGNTPPATSETIVGETSGGDGTVGTVVSRATAGTALLLGLDDQGTTGNVYLQILTGLDPSDGYTLYGATSNNTIDVNGIVATRTINNQFVGVYTGANYQTNFGIGLDASDGIVGDKFPSLDGTTQEPPNNQTGAVNSLEIGDVVTVYPWDGTATDINGNAEPDFNEMLLATALVAATSTTVDVGTGNIPSNTPSAGFLRIERDSDNNLDLVEYSAHNSDDTFTLVGTAPSAAAIGNTAMRALLDKETPTTQESFTALYGAPDMKVAITVLNGGGVNGPIKPYKATATFGSSGFINSAIRQSDA